MIQRSNRYRLFKLFRIKWLILCMALILNTILCSATIIETTVSCGQVLDAQNNNPIEGVIVIAHTDKGKRIVETDSIGRFKLSIDAGISMDSIDFRHFGYESYRIENAKEPNLCVKLQPKVNVLSEVIVQNSRIYRSGGKTIIDVSQFPNLDQQTSRFLKQIPGVTYTSGEGLCLNGKPVVLYVNGVKQNITQESLNTFLDNLPANALSTIELTNINSGEYSASTEAVMNINLNKMIPFGHSVQPNLFSTIFPHGLKKIGGNIFYMTKINSFVFYNTLSYSREKLYEKTETRLCDEEKVYFDNHSFKNGTLNTITYQASGIYTFPNGHFINMNFFSYNDFGNNKIDWEDQISDIHSLHNNTERSDLWNVSVSYAIPSNDRKFSGNIGYSGSYGSQNLNTKYESSSVLLYDNSLNKLNGWMHTINGDFNLKFKNIKMSFGVQGDYNVVSDQSQYNNTIIDNNVKTLFDGAELILAGYCMSNFRLNKLLNIRAGMRIESTNYSYEYQYEKYHKNFINLFPSLLLDYNNENYNLTTGIISNISRPKYEYLIPSKRKINNEMLYEGNPNLKPIKYYSIIANNTFLKYWQLNLCYSRYIDLINSYFRYNENTLISSFDNIFNADIISANIVLPFEFYEKKLFGQIQAYVSFTKYSEPKSNYIDFQNSSKLRNWRHNYNFNLNYVPFSRLSIAFDGNIQPKYRTIVSSRTFNFQWDFNISYAALKEQNLIFGLNIERNYSRDRLDRYFFANQTYLNKIENNGMNFRFSIKYVFNKGQKVVNEYRSYTPNMDRFR